MVAKLLSSDWVGNLNFNEFPAVASLGANSTRRVKVVTQCNWGTSIQIEIQVRGVWVFKCLSDGILHFQLTLIGIT